MSNDDAREKRLAEALRANLRRRKAQARTVADSPGKPRQSDKAAD